MNSREPLADSLGYRPDAPTGGVGVRTVGLVVPDIANPNVAPVVRGIEDTLDGHGLVPVISETRDNRTRARRVLDHLLRRRVDAVITTATRSGDRTLVEEFARHVPTVLAVRPLLDSGLATVAGDDRMGAGMVAGHLAGLGHQRVAQLTGPRDVANFALRSEGFAVTAQRAGLRVLEIPETASAPTLAEGRRLMLALLQRHPHPPTGVFAHNDLMAFGALAVLRKYGVACPDDLSLVGYDDSPAAALTHPTRSTVRLPALSWGAAPPRRRSGCWGGPRPIPGRCGCDRPWWYVARVPHRPATVMSCSTVRGAERTPWPLRGAWFHETLGGPAANIHH